MSMVELNLFVGHSTTSFELFVIMCLRAHLFFFSTGLLITTFWILNKGIDIINKKKQYRSCNFYPIMNGSMSLKKLQTKFINKLS